MAYISAMGSKCWNALPGQSNAEKVRNMIVTGVAVAALMLVTLSLLKFYGIIPLGVLGSSPFIGLGVGIGLIVLDITAFSISKCCTKPKDASSSKDPSSPHKKNTPPLTFDPKDPFAERPKEVSPIRESKDELLPGTLTNDQIKEKFEQLKVPGTYHRKGASPLRMENLRGEYGKNMPFDKLQEGVLNDVITGNQPPFLIVKKKDIGSTYFQILLDQKDHWVLYYIFPDLNSDIKSVSITIFNEDLSEENKLQYHDDLGFFIPEDQIYFEKATMPFIHLECGNFLSLVSIAKWKLTCDEKGKPEEFKCECCQKKYSDEEVKNLNFLLSFLSPKK